MREEERLREKDILSIHPLKKFFKEWDKRQNGGNRQRDLVW